MSKKQSQRGRIFDVLVKGRDLTESVANRLGIPFTTVSKRVHDLRSEGWRIYTDKKTLKGGPNRGKTVTVYRLDKRQQV
jgi:biotin operon repressor